MSHQSHFEYLCRVCAVNTKGKNSQPECVYIFKTPNLKEKIEKYLYLKISAEDELPKVLCNACFRQVERSATLSQIAIHTEKVLLDFLQTAKQAATRENDYVREPTYSSAEFTPIRLTKRDAIEGNEKKRANHDASQSAPPPPPLPPNPPSQPTTSVMPPPLAIQREMREALIQQQQKHRQLQKQQEQRLHLHLQQQQQQQHQQNNKDEVIVNVSVNDPLTRETQYKILSASQKRQNQSISDTRFTPKSIAQRSFSSTPKTIETANSNLSSVPKKASPAGVINFFHGKPQQVTITKDGCIVGRVAAGGPSTALHSQQRKQNQDGEQADQQPKNQEQRKRFHRPPQHQQQQKDNDHPDNSNIEANISQQSNPKSPNSSPPLPISMLAQEKRKNLHKTLKNIRLTQTGQVSLLKSSQRKTSPEIQVQSQSQTKTQSQSQPHLMTSIAASAIPRPKARLIQIEDTPSEPLPSKIIIAAAKSQKQHSTLSGGIPSSSTISNTNKKEITTAAATTIIPDPRKNISKVYAAKDLNETATTLTGGATDEEGIPEDMLLGRVIKDFDLLKLILRALKWPVNKQTMDLQMTRLKNSKFSDIMSDPILLQDTDLTQIMAPYLVPAMLSYQHQSQQQQQQTPSPKETTPTSTTTSSPTTPSTSKPKPKPQQQQQTSMEQQTAAMLAHAIPYKLPAETSVHMVPASPEAEEPIIHIPENINVPSHQHQQEAEHRPHKRSLDTEKTIMPSKKARNAQRKSRIATSIVLSDEEIDEASTSKKATNANGCHSVGTGSNVPLDSAALAQLIYSAGHNENVNAALIEFLQKQQQMEQLQQEAVTKTLKRHKAKSASRSPTKETSEAPFETEDIVLMEPSEGTDNVNPSPRPPVLTLASQKFLMPKQTADATMSVTRPIIKKRKTVIQSGKTGSTVGDSIKSQSISTINSESSTILATDDLSADESHPPSTTSTTGTATTSSDIITTSTTNTVISQECSDKSTTSLEVTSATDNEDTVKNEDNDASVNKMKAIESNSRKLSLKSPVKKVNSPDMLETTKLEPVGNKSEFVNSENSVTDTSTIVTNLSPATKLNNNGNNKANTNTQSSVTATTTTAKKSIAAKSSLGQQLLEAIGLQQNGAESGNHDGKTNGPQSVQQIRTALKRSLKERQEQQQQQLQQQKLQRKQEETTVIQVADSTTRSVIKQNDRSAMNQLKNKNLRGSSVVPVDDDDNDDVEDDVNENDDRRRKAEPSTTTNKRTINLRETERRSASRASTSADGPKGRRLALNLKNNEIADKSDGDADDDDDDNDNEGGRRSSQKRRVVQYVSIDVTDDENDEDDEQHQQQNVKHEMPKKRGRKTKEAKEAELRAELLARRELPQRPSSRSHGRRSRNNNPRDNDSTDDEDDANIMTMTDGKGVLPRRPARVSKTMSKYYKEPSKPEQTTRRPTPQRSTRNRN